MDQSGLIGKVDGKGQSCEWLKSRLTDRCFPGNLIRLVDSRHDANNRALFPEIHETRCEPRV